MNLLKRKTTNVEEIGVLALYKNNGWYWYGHISAPGLGDFPIELHVHVEMDGEILEEHTKLIKHFLQQYQEWEPKLLSSIRKSFMKLGDEKSMDELRGMYLLSAIALQEDKKSWWVIFEPSISVETKYNFLPRFTLQDDEIIWSNIS